MLSNQNNAQERNNGIHAAANHMGINLSDSSSFVFKLFLDSADIHASLH